LAEVESHGSINIIQQALWPEQPKPDFSKAKEKVEIKNSVFQFDGGSASLLFEKNFEGEVDEGIEWLITLFRLRPDQSALPTIEEE